MPDSRAHRLYVHLAWSAATPGEGLPAARRAAIETAILDSCRRAGADPVEVTVLEDRVYLLLRLPASVAVGTIESRMRGDVETRLAGLGRVVRWAPGFAAMTVSPREVRRARKKIARLAWTGAPGLGGRAPRDGTGGAGESRVRRIDAAPTGSRRRVWPKRSSYPPRGSGES